MIFAFVGPMIAIIVVSSTVLDRHTYALVGQAIYIQFSASKHVLCATVYGYTHLITELIYLHIAFIDSHHCGEIFIVLYMHSYAWLGRPSTAVFVHFNLLCTTVNNYTLFNDRTELHTPCAIQVNGILLTISLVSLAKSQCEKIGDSKNDKQIQQYLQTGK